MVDRLGVRMMGPTGWWRKRRRLDAPYDVVPWFAALAAAALLVPAGPVNAASLQSRARLGPVRPSAGHLIVGRAIVLPRVLYESGTPGSASLVTPAEAQTVVRAMWPLWERALIASDTRALSQLESPGPMRSGTIYQCAIGNASCVYEKAPRPLRQVVAIVPLQRSYPIDFLAEVVTTQTVNKSSGLARVEPWIEVQIYTKASRRAPWQISLDSGYDGVKGVPSFLPFDLSPAGPIKPGGVQDLYNAPPQRRPPVPPRRFLSLLARYWQSYKDTGHAPAHSLIVAAGYGSVGGEALARVRQGSIYAGSRHDFALTADPRAGEWAFTVAGAAQMICGSVLDTDTATPVQGLLNQNQTESNWGVPLPSGQYLEITSRTEHESCVYVVQQGLEAIGNNVYSSNVTGRPASALLSNLDTQYGVLAGQIQQYETEYVRCLAGHRSDTAGCLRPFARSAQQQFALFEEQLMRTDTFPARAVDRVKLLAATCRQLVGLLGKLQSDPQFASTLRSIEAQERTLVQQYDALFHSLS